MLVAAKAEQTKRRSSPIAWATDALLTASPAELAEDWPKIRAAYGAYPSAHLELARLHPAPYLEYAHTIDNPDAPEHLKGQPIQLGKMHVEALQVLMQHRLVCWVSSREHMATTCALGLLEWMLGRDPDRRLKVIGESVKPAKDRVGAIRDRIEKNARVREVFPHLVPDPRGPWSPEQITVHRRSDTPEPSMRACGILGAGTGGRSDVSLYDDGVGKRNAITNPSYKPQVTDSFFSDWFGTGAGGAHWWIANFWAPDDCTQVLRKKAEADGGEYETLPSGGRLVVGEDWTYLEHSVNGETMASPWDERYAVDDMRKIKRSTLPATFARGWECRRPTDAENEFQPEWFRYEPNVPRERRVFVVQMVDTAKAATESSAWHTCGTLSVIEQAPTADNPYGVRFHLGPFRRIRDPRPSRKLAYVKRLVREHDPDVLGVEDTEAGSDFAYLLEDALMMEVERMRPYASKRERLNRQMLLFKRGLVTLDPELDPDWIAAQGDPSLPNPVGEILGSVDTMDCADVAEMLLRAARERYVFAFDDEGDDDDLEDPADVEADRGEGKDRQRARDGNGNGSRPWWADSPTDDDSQEPTAAAQRAPAASSRAPRRGGRRGSFQSLVR